MKISAELIGGFGGKFEITEFLERLPDTPPSRNRGSDWLLSWLFQELAGLKNAPKNNFNFFIFPLTSS